MVKNGNSLSSTRCTDMGIPQGSIISPLLFNIMVHDLPKCTNKKINLVQYADDIAIWMNVSLKPRTSSCEIKYVQQFYQLEINNIIEYMKINGLVLSHEKTKLIFFNKGANPKTIPKIYLDETELVYVSEVKFLGVYLTKELNWKKHIDHLLQKAVKNYNLLKIISTKKWGQNTKVLLQLAVSLVRSQLTFGQEVYSAANCYLKKLQSLDSKAIKLAIGVPIHTKTSEVYKAAGILPLNDWRRLQCAKYIVRASAVDNFTEKELFVQSDIDFPKRAHSTQCLQTIYSYTNDVFLDTTLNPRHVSKQITATPIPSWELNTAKFDIFHTNLQKNNDINLLVEETRIHLHETYYNDMKIYTDGSVLENGDVGAGFVIPYLNIKESFFLGKGYSIFTAELTAILMALRRILKFTKHPTLFSYFPDSKSALQAIQSNGDNEGKEIIYEIRHTIHSLSLNNTMVCFC